MNLITENNIWHYSLNGENETIEFKHSFPKSVSNIERNISAFAPFQQRLFKTKKRPRAEHRLIKQCTSEGVF